MVGTLAAAAQVAALALGFGPLVAALLALTVAALVTGALHLDGLADVADGIGGGRDRAHCLEIMRDSRIGSYGVIALVLALALAAAGLADLPEDATPAVLLLAATGSRLAMLVVLDRLPPARPDGLGRGASGSAPLSWAPGAGVVVVLSLWIGAAALNRPALAAARVPRRDARHARRLRHRDPRHVGAGAPADRGDGGLWHGVADGRDPSDAGLAHAYDTLHATRPTAINLRWALDEMRRRSAPLPPLPDRAAAARAAQICDEDVEINRHDRHPRPVDHPRDRRPQNRGAGQHPDPLQRRLAGHGGLGHRHLAHLSRGRKGIDVHVWVDETRPRNQGAHLTAWEMASHGIPHHLIVDNAGGHLMQHGQVDMVIVGTDRTTAQGDVCNKIGTYLKALAAHDNGVPFYVALPSPTIDWR
jgi:hypothetical protein